MQIETRRPCQQNQGNFQRGKYRAGLRIHRNRHAGHLRACGAGNGRKARSPQVAAVSGDCGRDPAAG